MAGNDALAEELRNVHMQLERCQSFATLGKETDASLYKARRPSEELSSSLAAAASGEVSDEGVAQWLRETLSQEHQRGAQGVLRRSRTSRLSCFNSAKKCVLAPAACDLSPSCHAFEHICGTIALTAQPNPSLHLLSRRTILSPPNLTHYPPPTRCIIVCSRKAADATPITTSSTSPSTSPQDSSPSASRLPSCAHKLPMDGAPAAEPRQDGIAAGDQGEVDGDDSAIAAMELSRSINTSARSLANRVRLLAHPFNPLFCTPPPPPLMLRLRVRGF